MHIHTPHTHTCAYVRTHTTHHSEYTHLLSRSQIFISECVGVSKVGFALIVLGLFSAGMSFVYGKIVKYVPRIFLTTAAALINLFFYLFLLFWSREPSFELIFLFAIFWGLADGVWNTMSASKCLCACILNRRPPCFVAQDVHAPLV